MYVLVSQEKKKKKIGIKVQGDLFVISDVVVGTGLCKDFWHNNFWFPESYLFISFSQDQERL